MLDYQRVYFLSDDFEIVREGSKFCKFFKILLKSEEKTNQWLGIGN